MGIIETKDFGVRYGEKVIFSDANIDIPAGRFFAILGENGAGKTSFVKALIGQNVQTVGQLSRQVKRIGFVPQFRDITRDYPLQISEFVGLTFNRGWRLWWNTKEKQAIQAALSRMDLLAIADQRLGLVSGGQKQRAFVAQTLVQQPDLLILDESTASLDHEHKVQLLKTVQLLQKEQQLTILFITHELKLISQFADGYLLFENGRVTQGDKVALQALTKQMTHMHEAHVHEENEVHDVQL